MFFFFFLRIFFHGNLKYLSRINRIDRSLYLVSLPYFFSSILCLPCYIYYAITHSVSCTPAWFSIGLPGGFLCKMQVMCVFMGVRGSGTWKGCLQLPKSTRNQARARQRQPEPQEKSQEGDGRTESRHCPRSCQMDRFLTSISLHDAFS